MCCTDHGFSRDPMRDMVADGASRQEEKRVRGREKMEAGDSDESKHMCSHAHLQRQTQREHGQRVRKAFAGYASTSGVASWRSECTGSEQRAHSCRSSSSSSSLCISSRLSLSFHVFMLTFQDMFVW